MSKMQRKPPRPPMQLTCDACGKTFMRAPSKYKAKYNFCSEACAWTAHSKARREATLLMSTPRYGWWAYAKWMIRSYKGGGLMTKAERAAVADAIAETEQLVDGAERLRLIDLVLWKRTHTLQGAAMAVYVSERTAQEWHRQFIRLVGQKRGLL